MTDNPTPKQIQQACDLINTEARAGGDGSTWNPLDFDVFPSLKVLADTIAKLDAMQAERDKAWADLREIDRNAEEGGWSFPDAAAKAKRVAAIAAPYRVETDPLELAVRGALEPIWKHGTPSREDAIAAVTGAVRGLEIGRSA